MNEFWLWFWRPIAEFFGVVAFIGAIILAIALAFGCWVTFEIAKERITKWRKP